MKTINPQAHYGIGEAAELAHRDRGTIRRYITQRPDLFPVTFDPMTHRKLISGETILKIRDRIF